MFYLAINPSWGHLKTERWRIRAAPGGNRHCHSGACRNLQPSPRFIGVIISRNMRSISSLKNVDRLQIHGVSSLKESVGSIILKWTRLFRMWVQPLNDRLASRSVRFVLRVEWRALLPSVLIRWAVDKEMANLSREDGPGRATCSLSQFWYWWQ